MYISIHSLDRNEQIFETRTHYWYPGDPSTDGDATMVGRILTKKRVSLVLAALTVFAVGIKLMEVDMKHAMKGLIPILASTKRSPPPPPPRPPYKPQPSVVKKPTLRPPPPPPPPPPPLLSPKPRLPPPPPKAVPKPRPPPPPPLSAKVPPKSRPIQPLPRLPPREVAKAKTKPADVEVPKQKQRSRYLLLPLLFGAAYLLRWATSPDSNAGLSPYIEQTKPDYFSPAVRPNVVKLKNPFIGLGVVLEKGYFSLRDAMLSIRLPSLPSIKIPLLPSLPSPPSSTKKLLFWRTLLVAGGQGVAIIVRKIGLARLGGRFPQNTGSYEYFVPFQR